MYLGCCSSCCLWSTSFFANWLLFYLFRFVLGVFFRRSVCSICLYFVLRIWLLLYLFRLFCKFSLAIMQFDFQSDRVLFLMYGIWSDKDPTNNQTEDPSLYVYSDHRASRPQSILCLFGLILYVMSQSTIFLSCWDRSSWVEPVLSKDKCVFLKDTTYWRL